ncbi:hypothetical protein [Nannocystis pusilla]|uniref:Uncharacterized protein n=1 Tax=Nannocystis pusilla TaxID=889268 RepID=A0ABS7TL08_9BACT|nr:hypothetical protein [Nannocystis pusilla]MBZ5708908.1 hypothetical protein [Nannocystis pusilla]
MCNITEAANCSGRVAWYFSRERVAMNRCSREDTTFAGARRSLVVALGLLAGCGDWRDGLSHWDGEYVDYYASSAIEVCGGTPAHVDGFAPFVAAELGLPAPELLAYSWLRDGGLDEGDFVGAHCGEGEIGCQEGRRAMGNSPLQLSQIVHAIAELHGVDAQPFLSIGLTRAYDWFGGTVVPSRWVYRLGEIVGSDELRDPLEELTRTEDALHFPTAGSFVMFLLSRHGPAPFLEWSRGVGSSRDLERLRDGFRAAYGVELDAEAKAYQAGPVCQADAFPIRAYDCVMPEIPWASGDRWSHTQSLDCASAEVIGGFDPEVAWPSLRSVTIEIPESRTYTMTVTGEGTVAAQLGACFGCPWDGRELTIEENGSHTVELAAGTYYLRMKGIAETPTTLTVTLE